MLPSELIILDFIGVRDITEVLWLDLIIGSKTLNITFLMVKAKKGYNALLGKDWIYTNMFMLSLLYQVLTFWLFNVFTKIIKANDKLFVVNIGMVDTRLYWNFCKQENNINKVFNKKLYWLYI